MKLRLREQRRWRFQPHTGSSKQRCHRFQTTAHLAYARRLRRQQASMHPPPRKLACNSIERGFNKGQKRCNPNVVNSWFEGSAGELHAKLIRTRRRPHGGHWRARRAWLRCRWAAAGPGRATRRRAERSSRRGRLAGGPPPTAQPGPTAGPFGARNTSA